jgi:biotin transporter BioY
MKHLTQQELALGEKNLKEHQVFFGKFVSKLRFAFGIGALFLYLIVRYETQVDTVFRYIPFVIDCLIIFFGIYAVHRIYKKLLKIKAAFVGAETPPNT